MTTDVVQLILARSLEAANTAASTEQAVGELAVSIDQRLARIEQAIERQASAEGWQSATEIGEWLGRSTQWVKEHGDALGGERDGPGATAKWLFLRSRVEAGLPSLRQAPPAPTRTAARRRAHATDRELLQVKR